MNQAINNPVDLGKVEYVQHAANMAWSQGCIEDWGKEGIAIDFLKRINVQDIMASVIGETLMLTHSFATSNVVKAVYAKLDNLASAPNDYTNIMVMKVGDLLEWGDGNPDAVTLGALRIVVAVLVFDYVHRIQTGKMIIEGGDTQSHSWQMNRLVRTLETELENDTMKILGYLYFLENKDLVEDNKVVEVLRDVLTYLHYFCKDGDVSHKAMAGVLHELLDSYGCHAPDSKEAAEALMEQTIVAVKPHSLLKGYKSDFTEEVSLYDYKVLLASAYRVREFLGDNYFSPSTYG